MDKYEQEIFDFLTQKENFDAMLKVNAHFGTVRGNLLDNFWNKVAQKLVTETKLLSNKWQVHNPDTKERNDAKLIIFKDSWKLKEKHPFVGVAWERLFSYEYYGVWCNKDSKDIDSALLNSSLDNLRNQLDFRADTHWWPLWQHGKYNFSIDANLSNILPNQLENSVDEYSQNLLDLLPQVESIIDKVLDAF